MTVIELYNSLRARLGRVPGVVDITHEADQIMRHRLGLDATQRLLHSSGEIGPLPLAAVEAALATREAGVPLAYALERTDFAGLTFVVTPAVLIPRWETEWLVNKFEDWYKERRQKEAVLLDLGCGSGCIGLTVAARYQQVSVTLADVSEAALDVARVNAVRLGVLERCEFRSGDWLAWAKRRERFDAILCNPPYITRYDDPQLADAVRRHEPALALFLDDAPQEFFFRLARKSVSHLSPGGLFAIEVGYDTAWPARCAFEKVNAISRGHEVHDFAGIERVIWGIRK